MSSHFLTTLTLLVLTLAACSRSNTVPVNDPRSSPEATTIDDSAGNESWPMFRLDLRHTAALGVGDLELNPQLVWRFNTGDVVESSPAVVDGVLYEGTFNRALFALDVDTGQELWRFPVGGLLRASPAVVDGTVYFGADDNRFYALEAATGAEGVETLQLVLQIVGLAATLLVTIVITRIATRALKGAGI